jgi:hypothetical protein
MPPFSSLRQKGSQFTRCYFNQEYCQPTEIVFRSPPIRAVTPSAQDTFSEWALSQSDKRMSLSYARILLHVAQRKALDQAAHRPFGKRKRISQH